jgi:putative DNA primase/helicase
MMPRRFRREPGRCPGALLAVLTKQRRWGPDDPLSPNQPASDAIAGGFGDTVERLSVGVLSEDSVALEFVNRYGNKVRFDHTSGAWFTWDGVTWRRDGKGLAFSWARALSRELALSEQPGTRKNAGRAAFCRGVEEHARRDQTISVQSDAWDRDPMLLGTPGGVVDLRTGVLRNGRQEDMITRTTAVAPSDAPDCPLWLQFLHESTGGDAELVSFLRQLVGYCLTGLTVEQVLAFLHGPGGNGKSVFVNTIQKIMGEYARVANIETFTESSKDRHTEELARLAGARMVTASETDSGRRWAEGKVKWVTGGDTISARFMHQNSFEFTPQFKLIILGNHAPAITNLDDALRRRFLIVPFTRKPSTPDPSLETKLVAEWSSILRWGIEGAVDWHTNRLARPAAVTQATREYFDEQDVFGQWLGEDCDVDHGNEHKVEKTVALFDAWKDYGARAGEPLITRRQFNSRMAQRGFEHKQIKALGTKGFRGIRLKLKSAFHEGEAER